MAAERFPVVLVDDGELDDVRGLLDELGLAFAHLRGGAIPKRIEPPRDLFLATMRRAALARRWPQSPDGCLRPVRIAFVDEDSPAARTALRKLGFAYLVRRPVHPVALRLLILRALYQGEERRSEVRVPVGVDVTLRTGLRRRDALLADLSRNGCRLVTDRALPAGARLTLHLPAALVGDGDLALGGRILRCERDARALADGGYQVAVRFESLRPAARQRLARLLGRRDLRIGPEPEPRVEPLRPVAADADPAPAAQAAATSAAAPDALEPTQEDVGDAAEARGAEAAPAAPARDAGPAAPAGEPPEAEVVAWHPAQAQPAPPRVRRARPGERPIRGLGARLFEPRRRMRLATLDVRRAIDGGAAEGAPEREAAATAGGASAPEPERTPATHPRAPAGPPAEAQAGAPDPGATAPAAGSPPAERSSPTGRLGAALIRRPAAERRGRPPERRRHERRLYERRILAEAASAMHRMLLGRDLSAGGMRVHRHPDLKVGARLRVALYDAAREAPIVVDAVVARDDGARGFGLQFLAVAPEVASRLEQLVAALPPVEPLVDGEAAALGTVVGEIVS